MIEDATTYRSKEQVLFDLSKALQFSPESLESNRKGKLSKDQAKLLWRRVIPPLVLMFAFAFGPLLIWTSITAARNQLSFDSAVPKLFNEISHPNDLFETLGKMKGVLMLGSIVGSLALAAFMAFRVPFPLYFDLLDRKVESREGRVEAREETTNRPNGRDPDRKIFFLLALLKHACQPGGLPGPRKRVHLHPLSHPAQRNPGGHRT